MDTLHLTGVKALAAVFRFIGYAKMLAAAGMTDALNKAKADDER